VNLTELIELCREAGLGNFGRSTSREELYAALEDDILPQACPLEEKRELMQTHIKKNYRRLRTQLPGCNGKCVSFGCPDLVVQRCWAGFKDDMI
jgi:hypothetical protein